MTAALNKLIEAVEAGTLSGETPHADLPSGAIMHLLGAYAGDLNAAKALHEALLPGWRARLDIGRRHRAWVISPGNTKTDAYADSPARA